MLLPVSTLVPNQPELVPDEPKRRRVGRHQQKASRDDESSQDLNSSSEEDERIRPTSSSSEECQPVRRSKREKKPPDRFHPSLMSQNVSPSYEDKSKLLLQLVDKLF